MCKTGKYIIVKIVRLKNGGFPLSYVGTRSEILEADSKNFDAYNIINEFKTVHVNLITVKTHNWFCKKISGFKRIFHI